MSLEQDIANILIERKLTIATAESCTGGLLSSRLTDVAGSSAFIKFNIVTYANEIKHKVLNVSSKTLETHGAVSPECAQEMVLGLKALTNADICVATTGLAGPDGGTAEKPVGLCYIGILAQNKLSIKKLNFLPTAERKTLKQLFATSALEMVFTSLK